MYLQKYNYIIIKERIFLALSGVYLQTIKILKILMGVNTKGVYIQFLRGAIIVTHIKIEKIYVAQSNPDTIQYGDSNI